MSESKRLAEICKREVKNRTLRNEREYLRTQQGIKRMIRDMLSLWKRKERESAELRKQEEKALMELRKKEEEMREKHRQSQRLNFLLSQTELYSHFMSHKMGYNNNNHNEKTEYKNIFDMKEINNSETINHEEEGIYINVEEKVQLAISNTESRIRKFDDECRIAQINAENDLVTEMDISK